VNDSSNSLPSPKSDLLLAVTAVREAALAQQQVARAVLELSQKVERLIDQNSLMLQAMADNTDEEEPAHYLNGRHL